MNSCKLISLDASTSSTGFGVFLGGNFSRCGLIKPYSNNASDRFKDMLNEILDVLNKEKPDIVVIERMHQTRNVDGFRKLCKLAGVVEYWCIKNGREYIELSPAQWRASAKEENSKLPRKREELKQWAIDRVKEIYNLDVTEDCAEGILIGYGYINSFI